MRVLWIAASAALVLASCGNGAGEADRRAEEMLRQKREAELEAKQKLMQAEREQAAAREAEIEAARRQEAEAGQAFAVGPITAGEDRDTQAIVDAALERMGGRKRVGAIATLSGRARLTGAVNQVYAFALEYPDKMLVDFKDSQGQVTRAMLVNGAKAYNITRGRVTEFVSTTLADTLLSIRGDPLCLMVALADGGWGYQLTYLGRAEVAGRRTDAVRVRPPLSREIIAFFDSETGRLIATRYEMSQGLVTVIDEKFDEVEGVMIGVIGKQIVGSMISTVTVTEIELNPELPKTAFDVMQHPLLR